MSVWGYFSYALSKAWKVCLFNPAVVSCPVQFCACASVTLLGEKRAIKVTWYCWYCSSACQCQVLIALCILESGITLCRVSPRLDANTIISLLYCNIKWGCKCFFFFLPRPTLLKIRDRLVQSWSFFKYKNADNPHPCSFFPVKYGSLGLRWLTCFFSSYR